MELLSFEQMEESWKNNPLYKATNLAKEMSLEGVKPEPDLILGLTDESMIHMEELAEIDNVLNPDLIIIASRHRSQAGKPALLVHTTGNWDFKAEFGGEPRALSHASGVLHKAGFLALLLEFQKAKMEQYVVDIEVTHHGPTLLKKPLIFIELGSSKEEWVVKKGGLLVAKSIIATLPKYLAFREEGSQKVCLGFGGTHYGQSFRRLILRSDLAMSFVCPKYFIQKLDYDLVKMMIDHTLEPVSFFLIDWKGTNSQDKQHLIPILEKFDIPVKKTKEF